MNVREIVKEWLSENGYDGLCNTFIECACFIDDIAPFDCMHETDCQAGYKCKVPDGYCDGEIDGICVSKENK